MPAHDRNLSAAAILAIVLSVGSAALGVVGCVPVRASGSAAPPELPEPPADRPLRAGFLVVDGVYNSELMAPYDVLHHTVFHTAPAPGIEVFTVSPDGRPVTTFEGIRITPHHSFASAPPIDVLVVPSAEESMGADLENRAMLDWVRETASSARYVMSLCDGAFVLAEAGLLDGLSATTFPSDYDSFAARFPEVHLRINVSFVHDGKFLTSQGGAKSYDVAMYLVDRLYGEAVAQGVGRGLLIPWPPEPHGTPAMVSDVPSAPKDGEWHPGTVPPEADRSDGRDVEEPPEGEGSREH